LAVLVLLNNFLHDFSAAGWLFGSVLLWSIMRKKNAGDRPDRALVPVVRTVLLLMSLSFVGIVIFGIIRTIAYRTYEWNQAAGQSQVTLLIAKHIIFTLVFIVGLVYYLRARRFVRETRNE
jgi:uncharacterized membrane protein